MSSLAPALRVTFVCQWYAPEPVTQPGWIVDGLRHEGVQVEVLTGIPNYPTGVVHAGYSAGRPTTEVVDGVHVRRAPLYPSHDRSTLKRILTYLSWAVSSTVVGWRSMRASDVVLVYSSPATAALGAMVQRILGGRPYVLQVQDLWPDSIFASGFLPGVKGRLARGVLRWVTAQFYRRASRVVVISPGMETMLRERGVPPSRISLVYNWLPSQGAVVDGDRRAAGSQTVRRELELTADDLVLLYAGNHGGAQGLEHAIRGVAYASRSGQEARPVHFVLVGDGVARADLARLAQKVAPGRVHLLGSRARNEVEEMMAEVDVHLVSLAADPVFEVTMPSKVQSILAAGRPIFVAGAGDVAELVRRAGAGIVCPPGDTESFAESVLRLSAMETCELEAMGTRGRAFYDAQMAVEVGAPALVSLLREVAEDRERKQ